MITVRKYASGDELAWNGFNAHSKNGTFLFDRNYMEYHRDRFQDESLLFFDDDELIAIMPCSRHATELRSHGGLTFGGLITDSRMKQHRMLECFDGLLEYARNNSITSILYKPVPPIFHVFPAQEDLYALWRCRARMIWRSVSATVDLRHPIKMSKGRKAQASRARREGVEISASSDYNAFIELENAVLMSRHGAKAVHTGNELMTLAAHFPENIRLVVAQRGGELLAGAVLYVYRNVVHTQYLANSDCGCEIGALDLLISEQMKHYTGKVDYFDFGTSMLNESEISEGLISQKEGFGGRAVMYDAYTIAIQ